jgi:hypothetical protein
MPMIITYLGREAVKIQYGDLVIAFNPPAKTSLYKINKFGADIALETLPHEDMCGGTELVYGDKKPFVISGPGEYEVNSIFIKGLAGESSYDIDKDDSKLINTIYALTVEGINMLYLGAQDGPLPKDTADAIDSVDILFLPIGGDGVLDAKTAYKLAMNLEPKIIIPIHFDGKKDEALSVFLKEAGEHGAPVDKLTIKKKDLEGKNGDIIVLSPQQ